MKFSLAEDERPGPRRRAPDRPRSTATSSAWRSPASSRSPTGCSRSRRAGCGSAAGSPTTAGRTAAATRAHRALRGPAAGAAASAGAGAGRGAGVSRRSSEPSARSRRAALVAAGRLARAPPAGAGRGPRGRAGPDARHRRALRRRARHSGRVHVTVELTATQPPQGHEDPPLLLRPGVPRRPAGHDGLQDRRPDRQPDRPGRPQEDQDHTLLRIDFGAAPASGTSRDVHAHLRHRRPGRRADPRGPDRRPASVRSGPGRSRASDAGRQRHRRLPGRLRRRGRGRRHPGSRRPTTTAGTIFSTGRLDQAAHVLRLLRRRPAERLHRDDRGRSTSTARPLDVRPRLARRPGLGRAGRRPARARRCRSCPSESACRGRRRPLVVAEAVSRSTGGYSGRYDPAAGRSRSPTTPTRSSCSTRRPTPGSTAACSPTAGRTRASRRGTRLDAAGDARGEGRRPTPLTPRAGRPRDPAQRLGPGRARDEPRPRTTATRRRAALAAADRRAGRAGRPGERLGGRRGDRRDRPPYQPTARAAAAPDRRRSPGRRTGAGCSTCSRTGPARRTTTCGGPGSSGPTEAPLLDARAAARRQYDAVVARGRRVAAARDRPRRDAGLAVRAGDGAPRRRRARSLDDRDAVTSAAAGAGPRACRDALETAFEGNGGFAAAAAEADAELDDDRRLHATPRRAARPTPGSSSRSACGATTPTPTSPAPRAPSRAATSAARSRRSARPRRLGRAPTDVGRSRLMTILAACSLAALVVRRPASRAGSAARRPRRRHAPMRARAMAPTGRSADEP